MENSQKTIDVDSDKGNPRNEESVNQGESLNAGENANVEQGNKNENETENNQGRRSWVWKHFTYVKGSTTLNCLYCKGMETLHLDPKADLESSFLKYLEEEGNIINKSEVEIYLSDGMEKRAENFDVLNWWKINSLKFPVLSQVARYVLGMPISTVASESAFSTGGRVIDPFRSSLTPKTAEALICAQDWIRSSPADLELPDVNAKAIEELQDKLEKIEADEFASGPKFFAPCLVEE